MDRRLTLKTLKRLLGHALPEASWGVAPTKNLVTIKIIARDGIEDTYELTLVPSGWWSWLTGLYSIKDTRFVCNAVSELGSLPSNLLDDHSSITECTWDYLGCATYWILLHHRLRTVNRQIIQIANKYGFSASYTSNGDVQVEELVLKLRYDAPQYNSHYWQTTISSDRLMPNLLQLACYINIDTRYQPEELTIEKEITKFFESYKLMLKYEKAVVMLHTKLVKEYGSKYDAELITSAHGANASAIFGLKEDIGDCYLPLLRIVAPHDLFVWFNDGKFEYDGVYRNLNRADTKIQEFAKSFGVPFETSTISIGLPQATTPLLTDSLDLA